MPNATAVILIPLLPLAGFLLLGLFGKNYFRQTAGYLGTALLLASTLLSFHTAYEYFLVYGKVDGIYRSFTALEFTWLEFAAGRSIDMGVIIDPISVMMLLVVTFISLMVHIYSLAYMKGEERFSVYYSFLSLFTFSMLGLVMATNLFQLYIFWELVGLSSFLLIGFYYNRASAVAAAKKAFIVTRFADFGFLIGILILSNSTGTFDIRQMIDTLTAPGSSVLSGAAASSFMGISALSWGAALIFMGGAGKSAMFPLHIWLPDAMEGPTPVSALIHAATMVVAGVYLVARLFPIYAITTPAVLEMIGWVGVLSALFAAVIACTQTDIKRILAYSTMSQIGFMMFALGVAGYGKETGLGFTASMFHLFTHALFKALLFLGAGAVIHAVHSNDMRDMGGLRKKLPVTHLTFLIACLAIAGIPPLSGFFSKEEILLAAYQNNSLIYWIALITSGLTAFYMFRLYFGVFWKKDPSAAPDTHGEGGFAMQTPLIILASGALLAGFIPFGNFVSFDGTALSSGFHLAFSIAPVTIGLAGILLAMRMYKKQNDLSGKVTSSLGVVYKAAKQKFYIDECYQFVTKKVLFNLVGKPAAWIDKHVVDGMVNLTGDSTEKLAGAIKKIQSGRVQDYAVYFLAGAIGLALIFIYLWR